MINKECGTMNIPSSIFIKISFFSLALVLLVGCETLKEWNKLGPEQPKYKYVPATKDDVSFVVLPFNDYLDQLEFAAQVESFLLQMGLSVVATPRGTKIIEERKGAGVTQDSGVSNLASPSMQREESQALRIERYAVTQETKADYIIETMYTGHYGTIKFTRKNDSKIIAVFSTYSSDYSFKEEMTKQLEKMQFIKQVEETPLNDRTGR